MSIEDVGRDPAAPMPGPQSSRKLRVLVVDDEEPIRLAIRIVLQQRGHEVLEAGTVAEGLAVAQADGVDVALVDLRLPGNGLNLLRELDQMPHLAGRTVLITGSVDLLLDENGDAVWPRWLTKPFEFDEMVVLVESLGRSRE